MFFDIETYLRRKNIEYHTSGKNVKKGNVNIACPFCARDGDPDSSWHMGIDPEKGIYGCWRNKKHRSGSLVGLIMMLEPCSKVEAERLLGIDSDSAGMFKGDMDFDSIVANLDHIFDDDEEEETVKTLKFDKNIHPLEFDRTTGHFYDYLINRGFRKEDVDDVIEEYDLHYSVKGDWWYRLIIPCYMHRQLVAYTGRDITGKSGLRYKSTKKEESVINIYDCLPNYDELMSSSPHERILFICEGPLDFMKVDFYGRKYGARATCLFTKAISEEQNSYLLDLVDRFEQFIVLLDPEELADATEMTYELDSFLKKVITGEVPDGAEDPGAMTPRQVMQMTRKYIKDLKTS